MMVFQWLQPSLLVPLLPLKELSQALSHSCISCFILLLKLLHFQLWVVCAAKFLACNCLANFIPVTRPSIMLELGNENLMEYSNMSSQWSLWFIFFFASSSLVLLDHFSSSIFYLPSSQISSSSLLVLCVRWHNEVSHSMMLADQEIRTLGAE